MQMLQGPQQMSIATFSSKYRSKKEISVFLTVSVGCYLCDVSNLSIYFLK